MKRNTLLLVFIIVLANSLSILAMMENSDSFNDEKISLEKFTGNFHENLANFICHNILPLEKSNKTGNKKQKLMYLKQKLKNTQTSKHNIEKLMNSIETEITQLSADNRRWLNPERKNRLYSIIVSGGTAFLVLGGEIYGVLWQDDFSFETKASASLPILSVFWYTLQKARNDLTRFFNNTDHMKKFLKKSEELNVLNQTHSSFREKTRHLKERIKEEKASKKIKDARNQGKKR